ncbi:MAG: MotA/TolQ/ExbB proton channel family protein, partial [bacterium]|nr:MotA/TolQ/ExbB proton channel family protein [bacterium]
MLKKIIMIVAFVFFAAYLIFWVTHFMVMGRNVSFVFSTMAQMGGAVAEEEEGGGEILFDTENANGMGKGGAIIAKGGGLVDFLAFLFFLTIFFIIERWVTFWQARGKYSESKLMEQVRDHLKGGRYDEAIGDCKKQQGVLGRVLTNGIERFKTMRGEASKAVLKESLSEAVEEQTALEVTLLERRLIAIATIASIATMAGLFGTVVGMIRAFSALSAKGRPDP